MSSSSWLERHDALKAQAEDLANSARREAESAASASGQGRGGMQSLAARRKLMEMSRVIASMEKLSQDNLRSGDEQLRVRVQSDLSELQRMQRQAMHAARSPDVAALQAGSRPARAEETAATRQHTDAELLQEQYAGLARQDEQLDRVAASVGRVHTQAEAVHGEVHEQVRVIDSLHRGTDGVTDRVASVRGRVEGVLARMNRKLFYAVCFAVPFCVMLALGLLIRYA